VRGGALSAGVPPVCRRARLLRTVGLGDLLHIKLPLYLLLMCCYSHSQRRRVSTADHESTWGAWRALYTMCECEYKIHMRIKYLMLLRMALPWGPRPHRSVQI
jgi:hypothetical protein